MQGGAGSWSVSGVLSVAKPAEPDQDNDSPGKRYVAANRLDFQIWKRPLINVLDAFSGVWVLLHPHFAEDLCVFLHFRPLNANRDLPPFQGEKSKAKSTRSARRLDPLKGDPHSPEKSQSGF